MKFSSRGTNPEHARYLLKMEFVKLNFAGIREDARSLGSQVSGRVAVY